jgi:hypothetical protein
MLLCIVSLVCILVVFFMDYTSEVKEGIVIKKRRKIDSKEEAEKEKIRYRDFKKLNR